MEILNIVYPQHFLQLFFYTQVLHKFGINLIFGPWGYNPSYPPLSPGKILDAINIKKREKRILFEIDQEWAKADVINQLKNNKE